MDLVSLKRHVFFELLNHVGRVFILVEHSEHVVLGTRRFTEDEKKNGIILVFNSKMKFDWDDTGIQATLVFGASPQKCRIPAESIIAVYSPEVGVQLVVSPPREAEPPGSRQGESLSPEEQPGPEGQEGPAGPAEPDNVIRFDAAKKQKGARRNL